jgi:hypothetical protein
MVLGRAGAHACWHGQQVSRRLREYCPIRSRCRGTGQLQASVLVDGGNLSGQAFPPGFAGVPGPCLARPGPGAPRDAFPFALVWPDQASRGGTACWHGDRMRGGRGRGGVGADKPKEQLSMCYKAGHSQAERACGTGWAGGLSVRAGQEAAPAGEREGRGDGPPLGIRPTGAWDIETLGRQQQHGRQQKTLGRPGLA